MVVYDVKKYVVWNRGKTDNVKKILNERTKATIKCKCGHSISFRKNATKVLCSWCGKYVFKNPQDEFKYRIKEKMK